MSTAKDNDTQQTFNTIIVATPDMTGRLVGRRMPYKKFGKKDLRARVCSSIVAWDVEQLLIDNVPKAGPHTGWQDVEIVAEPLSVRRLGWLNKTAIAIGDIYDPNGKIAPIAPRAVLRKQIQLMEKAGLKATVATELEFYLVPISNEIKTSDKRHDYAIDVVTNGMEYFFEELREVLADSGITVESWQSEWGLGQWEVNLERGTPMEIADNHLLFKLAVKELALKYGYKANFMAKPEADDAGSSGHIHISLHDASGKATFFDDSMPHNVSHDALYAIAGILQYTYDCMPLYAGNINSYRRLAANELCGSNPSWGFDNRTATCRVIGKDKEALHLEFRLPGADVNPYLALAGILASVRRGISDKREPGQACTGVATAEVSQRYPLSLEVATDRFMQSSFAKEELGVDFVSHYGFYLLHECQQFSVAVTDWELKRYEDSM